MKEFIINAGMQTSQAAKLGHMYELAEKVTGDTKHSGDEKLAQQLWNWAAKTLEPYR